MNEYLQDMVPTGVYIIHADVEVVQFPPRRMSSRLLRRWQQWWTEERLAILALVLGNTCLLSLVLWWIS